MTALLTLDIGVLAGIAERSPEAPLCRPCGPVLCPATPGLAQTYQAQRSDASVAGDHG
jgi:hypothetical protein